MQCISVSKASIFTSPPPQLSASTRRAGLALRHLCFLNFCKSSARVSGAGVCLNNCDRLPGLREEITIFLLKFAAVPWRGDATLRRMGLPRLRIKSALLFISLLVRSSLWLKSSDRPALNVNAEGRSFNSSSLQTKQTPQEKVRRSMPGGCGTCGSKCHRGRQGPGEPPPTCGPHYSRTYRPPSLLASRENTKQIMVLRQTAARESCR